MRRLPRLVARVLGIALIGLLLWLAGWNDRVTDERGREHLGRIVSRTDREVVLETERGEERIAIEGPGAVHPGLRGAFTTLARRPAPALLGLALHALGTALAFVRWGVLLRGADLETPMGRVFRLGWVGQFMGNVLPGGVGAGDVVRAVYVAAAHPGSKARAVVTVFVDRAVGVCILSLLALTAALAAPADSDLAAARPVLAVLFAVAAAGMTALLWGRARRATGLAALLRRFPELGRSIETYGRRLPTVGAAAAITVVAQACMLLACYFYGGALGAWMNWLAVLVALPVAMIVGAIPGLPGGWGVGDAAFFFFLQAAGVPGGTALALSFTYRTLHIVVSLPGALWLAPVKSGTQN